MTRWMTLCTLICALLPWPTAAGAAEDAARGDTNHMTAKERRLTSYVSRVVFATQAAERAEVERLGLEGLEREIETLRREVDVLAFAEARARVAASVPGGAAAMTDERPGARTRMNASLTRLAARRTFARARLGEIKSPRQRRLMGRALEELDDLDQQVRAAADAPSEDRADRLARVKDRLSLEGLAPAKGTFPEALNPTFQMVPEDRLPKVTVD